MYFFFNKKKSLFCYYVYIKSYMHGSNLFFKCLCLKHKFMIFWRIDINNYYSIYLGRLFGHCIAKMLRTGNETNKLYSVRKCVTLHTNTQPKAFIGRKATNTDSNLE